MNHDLLEEIVGRVGRHATQVAQYALGMLLMQPSSNLQPFLPSYTRQANLLLLPVGLKSNNCTLLRMCTGDLSRNGPRPDEFASRAERGACSHKADC